MLGGACEDIYTIFNNYQLFMTWFFRMYPVVKQGNTLVTLMCQNDECNMNIRILEYLYGIIDIKNEYLKNPQNIITQIEQENHPYVLSINIKIPQDNKDIIHGAEPKYISNSFLLEYNSKEWILLYYDNKADRLNKKTITTKEVILLLNILDARKRITKEMSQLIGQLINTDSDLIFKLWSTELPIVLFKRSYLITNKCNQQLRDIIRIYHENFANHKKYITDEYVDIQSYIILKSIIESLSPRQLENIKNSLEQSYNRLVKDVDTRIGLFDEHGIIKLNVEKYEIKKKILQTIVDMRVKIYYAQYAKEVNEIKERYSIIIQQYNKKLMDIEHEINTKSEGQIVPDSRFYNFNVSAHGGATGEIFKLPANVRVIMLCFGSLYPACLSTSLAELKMNLFDLKPDLSDIMTLHKDVVMHEVGADESIMSTNLCVRSGNIPNISYIPDLEFTQDDKIFMTGIYEVPIKFINKYKTGEEVELDPNVMKSKINAVKNNVSRNSILNSIMRGTYDQPIHDRSKFQIMVDSMNIRFNTDLMGRLFGNRSKIKLSDIIILLKEMYPHKMITIHVSSCYAVDSLIHNRVNKLLLDKRQDTLSIATYVTGKHYEKDFKELEASVKQKGGKVNNINYYNKYINYKKKYLELIK